MGQFLYFFNNFSIYEKIQWLTYLSSFFQNFIHGTQCKNLYRLISGEKQDFNKQMAKVGIFLYFMYI